MIHLLPIAIVALTMNQVPAPLVGVKRIVCLGDSITEGGDGPGGYVGIMRSVLATAIPNQPIEVVNAGVSGHKSTNMRARFQKDVLDKKPDLVTISVGVNDVWHGFDKDHPKGGGPGSIPLTLYGRELQAMIDAANARRIRVVLLAPTPIYEDPDNEHNKKLALYVKAMQDRALRNGVIFIDLNRACWDAIKPFQRIAGEGQNLLTTDGVHMGPAGNKLMAHQVLLGLGLTQAQISAARR